MALLPVFRRQTRASLWGSSEHVLDQGAAAAAGRDLEDAPAARSVRVRCEFGRGRASEVEMLAAPVKAVVRMRQKLAE